MDTKAEGTVQEVVGKVQDTAGDVLGDTTTQLKGKARELGGKAQQLYADTASVVRVKATESPLGTLALVAVASFDGRTVVEQRFESGPEGIPERELKHRVQK